MCSQRKYATINLNSQKAQHYITKVNLRKIKQNFQIKQG